jgi:hypothetical protein
MELKVSPRDHALATYGGLCGLKAVAHLMSASNSKPIDFQPLAMNAFAWKRGGVTGVVVCQFFTPTVAAHTLHQKDKLCESVFGFLYIV